MTVRDATRRASPDGHVLYIEELRKHLGIWTDVDGSSSRNNTYLPNGRPEVLLIGHDMHDDFRKMQRDGIDIGNFMQYSGCVDTEVLIEDTNAPMGKSPGSLVNYYSLAKPEWKKPGCPGKPVKLSYNGSHNGGNDSVMTTEGSIELAFDLSLRTTGRSSTGEEDLPEDWFDKPLTYINTNMILLGYDTETVETPNYKPKISNRTSEHGFSWLRLAEIAHIAPGKNGRNWTAMIRARHWINEDFRNFRNWFYCVGNPNGFWPQYGRSQYYRVSEGPAPFHKLFEEIATGATGIVKEDDSVEEVTERVENTSLGNSRSGAENGMVSARGKRTPFRGRPTRRRGNASRYRGDSARGTARNRGQNININTHSTQDEEVVTENSGSSPNDRSNSNRGREFATGRRGSYRGYRGKWTRGRGNPLS